MSILSPYSWVKVGVFGNNDIVRELNELKNVAVCHHEAALDGGDR
jgi:hypothetical protein